MCSLSFTRTKMIIRLIIFFVALNCFIIAELPYKACHPEDPINRMTRIDYGNCTTTPCVVRRGTNITAAVSFVPVNPIKLMRNILYFEFQGARINHPQLHGTDACENILSYPDRDKIGCPLEKGKRYIYEQSAYINATLPRVPKILVHWAIRDREAKKDVLCYNITIRIA